MNQKSSDIWAIFAAVMLLLLTALDNAIIMVVVASFCLVTGVFLIYRKILGWRAALIMVVACTIAVVVIITGLM